MIAQEKSRRRRAALLIAILFAALSAALKAQELPEPADRVTPAWYLGLPVVAYSYFNRGETAIPTAGLPEMGVYLVAPMSPTAGYSPQRPGPRGIPDHMTVLSAVNTPARPGISHGYLVQPGPHAGEDTVRLGSAIEVGMALLPLVSHIRVGTDWLPLNSHALIDFGLERGWLQLQHLGSGTLIWATADWDAQQPMDRAPCSTGRTGLSLHRRRGRNHESTHAAAVSFARHHQQHRDGIRRSPGRASFRRRMHRLPRRSGHQPQ